MAGVFLAIGGVFLIFFVVIRQVLGRPPVTTRAASMVPLMQRLNIALAACGVALIVLGLLYPHL